MDPDATLNEIRELCKSYFDPPEGPQTLADKFNALDAWLTSGGFLPSSWDLSIPRTMPPREPETHETIWCERCAKGEHNFVKDNDGKIYCLCCSVERT